MEVQAVGRALAEGRQEPRASPRLEKAAKDFEALVIHNILKEVMPQEGDATIAQFGSEALANAIAAQGGLGLRDFLTEHLRAPADAAGGSGVLGRSGTDASSKE